MWLLLHLRQLLGRRLHRWGAAIERGSSAQAPADPSDACNPPDSQDDARLIWEARVKGLPASAWQRLGSAVDEAANGAAGDLPHGGIAALRHWVERRGEWPEPSWIDRPPIDPPAPMFFPFRKRPSPPPPMQWDAARRPPPALSPRPAAGLQRNRQPLRWLGRLPIGKASRAVDFTPASPDVERPTAARQAGQERSAAGPGMPAQRTRELTASPKPPAAEPRLLGPRHRLRWVARVIQVPALGRVAPPTAPFPVRQIPTLQDSRACRAPTAERAPAGTSPDSAAPVPLSGLETPMHRRPPARGPWTPPPMLRPPASACSEPPVTAPPSQRWPDLPAWPTEAATSRAGDTGAAARRARLQAEQRG
jgi:hypothetical protein